MSLLSGISDFFGLDIGTTAIRVVQLSGPNLSRYGSAPINVKTSTSDSAADLQKVGEVVRTLLGQARISSRNVAVGIPSNKVFATVVDIDRLPPKELEKTIKYQIENFIPMQVSEAKYDWALLGDSPKDKSKVEVLISSVGNKYIEQRLDMLESIGLNVVAFEPDSMAITRSLTPPETKTAQLLLDIGNDTTDLVLTLFGMPRLVRSISTGTSSLIKAAVQNLNIDEMQAQQFVFKFGLAEDKLEGQVFKAIVITVDSLISEIDKSIKFFTTRYEGVNIEKIVVTGGASVLPSFPVYLANKTGLNVEIGNAWRNVTIPSTRQNDLMAVANHFAVASGLAERVV